MSRLPGEGHGGKAELAAAAYEVRQILSNLVTHQTGDLYPWVLNNAWLEDKSIFIQAEPVIGEKFEGNRFGSMVTLDRDGSVRSGLVEEKLMHRPDADPWDRGSMTWDMDSADLEPASDLEVLEHGSALASELFRLVAEKAHFEPSVSEIQRIIKLIETRPDTMAAIQSQAIPVLKHHFGDNYSLPVRTVDDIQQFGGMSIGMIMATSEWDGEFANAPSESIELLSAEYFSATSMKAALDLHFKREAILEKLTQDAVDLESGLEAIKGLVEAINHNGLFPMSSAALVRHKRIRYINAGPVTDLGSGDRLLWVLFNDGSIGVRAPMEDPIMDVPEHAHKDIVQIGDSLIREVVRERFRGMYAKEYGN